MPKPNLTIVTAFVGGINSRADRDIHAYIELGTALLSAGFPTVFFVDSQTHMQFFADKEAQFPNTRFVVITPADIYLFHYKDAAVNFNPKTSNPAKDTYEFVAVQCNKTEWVREAIELDFFRTDQFAWIDFGIMNVFKDSGSLSRAIAQMDSKSYQKVRMPNTKPPTFDGFSHDILNYIVWMIPGSVFGGHKLALTTFARRVKEKCLSILCNHKLIVWEINIFKLVFFENVDLFDLYPVKTHDEDLCLQY